MDDFLFATPGFLKDMGRAIDFGDTMTQYNRSESSEAADLRALKNDWAVIGNDIKQAAESLVK
jgi:hypothetical protein